MKKTIVVFARAPVAGRVKTRLARHLGDEAARSLYAAMLRDTLSLARRASRNLEECQVVVAYTPDDAFGPGPDSLAGFWSGARMAQSEGDIGARMLDCIARLQGQGSAQVVLIGSDAPDLFPSYISHAFGVLEKQKISFDSGGAQVQAPDLVLGPACDGGFYLIGAANSIPPELFEGVEWSVKRTLKQVKANSKQLGLRLSLLARHNDIDNLADLRRFARRKQENHIGGAETWHFLVSRKLSQSRDMSTHGAPQKP